MMQKLLFAACMLFPIVLHAQEPSDQKILITEIFADPNPKGLLPDSLALPQDSHSEFVELYNATTDSLELENYTLNGGRLHAFSLPPNGYVILCQERDASLYAPFGPVVTVTSWNTLSNGGEKLLLKNAAGQLVDSLHYDSGWYQDNAKTRGGWSLERINLYPQCGMALNWKASEAFIGATPGQINAVDKSEPDTTLPSVDSLIIADDLHISVVFSEGMDTSSIVPAHFLLNEHFEPIAAQLSSTTEALLTFADSLPANTLHTFHLSKLADCNGNLIKDTVLSFSIDRQAPQLLHDWISNWNELRLAFSEKLSTSSTQNVQNFLLLPDSTACKEVLFLSDSILQIEFASTFDPQQEYQFWIAPLEDRYGNTSQALSRSVLFDHSIDSLFVLEEKLIELQLNKVPVFTGTPESHFYHEEKEAYAKQVIVQSLNPPRFLLLFEEAFHENKPQTLQIFDITNTLGFPLTTPSQFFTYDTRPPAIRDLKIVSQRQIRLYFNEELKKASAEALHPYESEELGYPYEAAWQFQDSSVLLSYSENFEQEAIYTLKIKGIEDVAGNLKTRRETVTFRYDSLPPALDSLIVFSKNHLQLLYSEPLRKKSVQPALFELIQEGVHPQAALVDSLRNTVVHLLFEKPLAEKDDYMLSIGPISDFSGNTSDSFNIRFSTIYPQLAQLTVRSPHEIHLKFSEPLAPLNKADTLHFSLENGRYAQQISQNSAMVLLYFDTSFTENKPYTLRLSGLTDLFENRLTDTIRTSFVYNSGLKQLKQAEASQLELLFEESIAATSAENVDNYQLENGQKPIAALQDSKAPELIRLWFGQTFLANKTYRLDIKNLFSEQGNSLPDSYHSFTPDSTPPEIDHFTTGADQVWINFNEAIDQKAAQVPEYYWLNAALTPDEVKVTDSAVTLLFQQPFEKETKQLLLIKQVTDLSNNRMKPDSLTFTYSPPETIDFNELLITEIMANPPGNGLLPDAEYLEIHNPTARAISLSNVLLTKGNAKAGFPDFSMEAGDYLIICRQEDEAAFSMVDKTIGLTQWPSLTNEGAHLRLINKSGELIFDVNYSEKWYQDRDKKDGGWSLEMIDPANPCAGVSNWAASEAIAQGTPGKINSVFTDKPDLSGVSLEEVIATTDSSLYIYFSEKLPPIDQEIMAYFELTNGPKIRSASLDTTSYRKAFAYLQEPLEKGRSYELRLRPGLYDCKGNAAISDPYVFVLPQPADSLDVILNEVLFNPAAGGVRFIELYNQSNKYISLKNWYFTHQVENNINSVEKIISEDFVLPPKTHVALTTDHSALKDQYPRTEGKNTREVHALPALNNLQGLLYLYDDNRRTIDAMHYADSMHHPLLPTTEGVSLERLAYDASSFSPENWGSAHQSAGFATPGYQNSHHIDFVKTAQGVLNVLPRVLSSSEGEVQIYYQFPENGFLADVYIFDTEGQLIRKLEEQRRLTQNGFLSWDGTNDHHQRVPTGYYVIWFKVFDLYGQENIYKETVAVRIIR